MKKFVLAITVLAFCSLSLAENASANHQSEAATDVRPATAPQFTVLHVFNGGPGDGIASACRRGAGRCREPVWHNLYRWGS